MKYIYTTLTLLLVLAIGYYSFGSKKNTSGKAQRLACHKETVVFERVYDDTLLKQAKDSLQSGNYELISSVQKSVHMQTRMFEYVDIKEVDTLVKDTIENYKTKASKTDDRVVLDYYIYENDKADPGKKTAKSKRYAGYLHFVLTFNGKRVYAVQVDFMDLKGKDIDKSVQCAIKSVMTLP